LEAGRRLSNDSGKREPIEVPRQSSFGAILPNLHRNGLRSRTN
jgi:hypothetical protein